jgi:CubicO group peptidase (beta-lactamase class C family)
MGLDTSKIGSVMRRILAGDFPNLHSVLVVKDGKIVLDEYFHGFNRDKPHRISSISKAVTAAAVGIAVGRGLIKDVHTPLSQFFPEYGDLLSKGEKSAITLYHLLTMTT